jgi:hypothetical protein
VVADHGEEWDVRRVEVAEDADGPQQVDQVGAAVVEQVARVHHRVHVLVDGVTDDLLEGVEEVLPACRLVVLPVTDVGVPRVEQPRHGPGLVGSP